MSPFKFNYRNCTDFVAFRLNAQMGGTPSAIKFSWSSLAFPKSTTYPSGDGNAEGWKQGALNSGYAVDNIPAVGAVAWWGSSATSPLGHIAIVSGVNNDGSVSVEEYNYSSPYGYGTRPNVRADAYLHIHDLSSPPPAAYIGHMIQATGDTASYLVSSSAGTVTRASVPTTASWACLKDDGYTPVAVSASTRDAMALTSKKAFCADENHDHIVNVLDLSILLSHYGGAYSAYTQGDLNADGRVDVVDLSILLSEYNKPY